MLSEGYRNPDIYEEGRILVNTEQMGDLVATKLRRGVNRFGDRKLNIYIYDTTLRDGSQGEGISLSVEDK